ncbi:MAG: hypothetical protein ACHQO8_05775 [Vicinamibacterales bacterium]
MRHWIARVCLGAFALVLLVMASASAQDTNPRFARWKLKSDNPASSNVMTYEAYNGTGMKVTIESVNASGNKSSWGYTTMFDGKDYPVTGRNGTATASVRMVNDKINEIIYRNAEGKVVQLLLNVLSADNNTIEVSYFTTNAQGATNVTHATYERIQQ